MSDYPNPPSVLGDEPRRHAANFVTTLLNAAGSIALLGCVVYSTQFQHRCFALFIEADYILVMPSKKTRNVIGAAVAQSDPDELWRRAAQDRQTMKIPILADNHASMLAGQIPNRHVARTATPQESNVQGVREDVRQ